MLNGLLNFLRFIRDPDIKATISHINQVILGSRKGWKEEIRTLKASFRGDEAYKVVAFANHAIEELRSAGIVEMQIDKFRTVFSELIRNAFEHGCMKSQGCRVSIRCTYCRWFIRLQIADSGKGFDLANTLERWRQSVALGNDRHGLWIVDRLSDSIRASKAGNRIIVFMLSSSRFKVVPTVHKHKGHEILILNVDDGGTWDYMAASWEPLVQALENVRQKLVLINCQAISWNSESVSEATDVVGDFRGNQEMVYAFVVERSNSKLFNHYCPVRSPIDSTG